MKPHKETRHLEKQEVHSRVAKYLDLDNLCYVHEYRTMHGIVDFVGISRDTGYLAIVECKVSVKDVHLVVAQINDYHAVFDTPSTEKRLFTLTIPSEKQLRVLFDNDVRVFGVDWRNEKADVDEMGAYWQGVNDHFSEFESWFRYWWGDNPPEFWDCPYPKGISTTAIRMSTAKRMK